MTETVLTGKAVYGQIPIPNCIRICPNFWNVSICDWLLPLIKQFFGFLHPFQKKCEISVFKGLQHINMGYIETTCRFWSFLGLFNLQCVLIRPRYKRTNHQSRRFVIRKKKKNKAHWVNLIMLHISSRHGPCVRQAWCKQVLFMCTMRWLSSLGGNAC